jgi:DNA-binding ferritin-like protein (Dps family)
MHATNRLTERRTAAEFPARRIVTRAATKPTDFADTYLEIARLLLAYGRTEVARRRLQRVVDKFGNTAAAAESQNLLTALETSEGRAATPPRAARGA